MLDDCPSQFYVEVKRQQPIYYAKFQAGSAKYIGLYHDGKLIWKHIRQETEHWLVGKYSWLKVRDIDLSVHQKANLDL